MQVVPALFLQGKSVHGKRKLMPTERILGKLIELLEYSEGNILQTLNGEVASKQGFTVDVAGIVHPVVVQQGAQRRAFGGGVVDQ